MTYKTRIAGPLEPFGSWQTLGRIYDLEGVTSTAMARDAVKKEYITKPGTYALLMANDLGGQQVCLVTVTEEPPVPVKPRLKVASV
jgi:hypothetical protein